MIQTIFDIIYYDHDSFPNKTKDELLQLRKEVKRYMANCERQNRIDIKCCEDNLMSTRDLIDIQITYCNLLRILQTFEGVINIHIKNINDNSEQN